MGNKTTATLIIVFLLALFFRLYRLGEVPVGFHGDEASIGYNAYSLLKTGRDQNGTLLPLAIDQFGDFRPAGYHYLAIPFIAAFGLNETATRLPAALVGAFTVIPVYFLVVQLFRKKSPALIASLFLAISPWHVTLSRATSESIVALFFVLWGVYFLLRRNWRYSFVALVLSFFFYHAARLFVPLFILIYAWFFAIDKRTKMLAILITGAAIVVFFFSNGLGRVGQVGIFSSPGQQVELRQQLLEDKGINPLLVRILHNKGTYYIWTIADNYLAHFNGKFLFLEGGQPVRYRVPWTGVLYLVDALFLAAGIAFLIKEKATRMLFLWLFLAPLPAAVTFGELPSEQRAIFMIPVLVILAACGVLAIMKISGIPKKFLIVGVVFIYAYQITSFVHNYFYHSFTHEPWYRNAAEKELVFAVDQYVKQGKKVVMTSQNDNNLIFYLFYLKFDPRKFQQMGSPRDKDNLVFEGMTFTYKHCPLEGSEKDKALGEPGVMYVNRGECKVPYNSVVLKEIRWPDDALAFQILQLK